MLVLVWHPNKDHLASSLFPLGTRWALACPSFPHIGPAVTLWGVTLDIQSWPAFAREMTSGKQPLCVLVCPSEKWGHILLTNKMGGFSSALADQWKVLESTPSHTR